MIPRPLQKYLFYIILFILVIGIVFISTKYILQRFFPSKRIEGFDVPDGPGLELYSNSTLTLAPGISRFLSSGQQKWDTTVNTKPFSHLYYGTINDTMKADINKYENMIDYFFTIATEQGTDDEKIPKLTITNGGTSATGWYASTPTYGRITAAQLRRISGPIADRVVRVVYLMLKAEINRVEQDTFVNWPEDHALIFGTYDGKFGGKNCNSDGKLCSSGKFYNKSDKSDYVHYNIDVTTDLLKNNVFSADSGARKHWRADFIQTKLPAEWIQNKYKMLAVRTYAKLLQENPDFAANYLAHTPEVGGYAEGAGMNVGMLLAGNLVADFLMNAIYKEVIEDVYTETGEYLGKHVAKKGIWPAIKGIYAAGKAPGKGTVLERMGAELVERMSSQSVKLKHVQTIMKTAKAGEEAAKDATIVAREGRFGLKVLAGVGRAGEALKNLAMVALGFERTRTAVTVVSAAKAVALTAEIAKDAATGVRAAIMAQTSLTALAGGVGAALASNPVGWGIAIFMALADVIMLVIDLVPKDKFQELGIQTANEIIADQMLKCPVGTMDGISLSDEEFSSVFEFLPLPANLGVKDIAMKKRLACVYTDPLGNTTMSQKTQCPDGNDDTCFAEAPLPIEVWPAKPDPVTRLTVLDLLERISDEIYNLSSDYITITGYEWAAVTAVNTMKSKLSTKASDFLSSYNAAVTACNLVQYNNTSVPLCNSRTALLADLTQKYNALYSSTGTYYRSEREARDRYKAQMDQLSPTIDKFCSKSHTIGIEWSKEGRSSYNAWWSDISGTIQQTPVANVNALTTPGNSDTFATRMLKNPFNWGDKLRFAPRFHNVLDIACVVNGKYPNVNFSPDTFLSTAKDDSYNVAVVEGADRPANTRYTCQPMDFYRTIKGVMIKAILRKEIEAMKAQMDKYPDLIGKFAEDPNLGDTPLSKILDSAATTAASASVEDAAAGRPTPSTTAARDAAIAAAVSGYNTAISAFYPVNIAYTTLSSFSTKIKTAAWLTKIASETTTTAAGGIYDVSNTLILTAAGVTFEELDSHPSYISKFSTDVSGAYWNKKNLISANASTRQANAIAAWTALKTDFTTANDPYAMTTVQWIIANVGASRVPATANDSDKAAAAKRFTEAYAPFKNTPSATMNTTLTNIISQLAATNKSAAVASSTDFLKKFNAFLSEVSYTNDDLENDKNDAYIKSITADAARIGYAAWKSKYIKTAIEMDALATAKSIVYALQTDGKKAEVKQSVADKKTAYITELINYNKYMDTRDYYINACNTPGWQDPYEVYTDLNLAALVTFSTAKERWKSEKRGIKQGIPIMEKANPWFLTPNGAQKAIAALAAGKTLLDDLITASKPTAADISTYGALPTIGWKWDAGVPCETITLNKEPCGINLCDGALISTRGEYQWTAQKCIDDDKIKRYNRMGSYTNFDVTGGDLKQKRMSDYFANVGGAICYEPGAQTWETPCVAGKEFQGGALCYNNCDAGKTRIGLNCYSDCPSGREPDAAGITCLDKCGDTTAGTKDYPIVGSDINCKQACDPQDLEYALACYAPCTNGWTAVAATKNCDRNTCDSEYPDEVTSGFCYKKCSPPSDYPSAYAITDSANQLNCFKQCTFDNNDGANLALVNVTPINVPTDIGNCLAWLDATTFVNGSKTWNSASSSLGYSMTVGGAPTLSANQLFSGSKNVLNLATTDTLSMTPVPSSEAFTMFFVSRQTGPTYQRVLMSEPNQLYGYWGALKNTLHMNSWQVGPWAVPATNTGANTTWDSYRVRRKTGGAGDMARFGSSLGSFTTGIGLSGLYVNKWEPSNAQIAEIIIYNRDLTDGECQQVENYLLAKWFKQRIRSTGLQRCYKDCGNGWTLNKDVGTCENNSCDANQWESGGLCYNPCGADRSAGGVGSTQCYLNAAPAGYHDNVPGVDGNYAQDCPAGKQLQAASKITCVDNCPSGTTFDGVATCNPISSWPKSNAKIENVSWPKSNVKIEIVSWPASNLKRTDSSWPASSAIQLSCPGGYHGAPGWCQSDTHSCGWNGWSSCNNMDPPTTGIRSSCPGGTPNNYNGTCYADCPAGQWMRTQGLCTGDPYCPWNTPYEYGGVCYAYCPAGQTMQTAGRCTTGFFCPADTPNEYASVCYAGCPAGQTMQSAGRCTTGFFCPSETPNEYLSVCYAGCPSGQTMVSAGKCSTGAAMKSLVGTEQSMPTIPKGILRTSRTKFQSTPNNSYDDRGSTNNSNVWARGVRAKYQSIIRTQTKTIGTKSRNSNPRSSVTQQPVHGVLTSGGCECVISNAWERANNGCGTFGRTVEYPVAPWGVAGWQVNTADATVQSLIGKLADLFVSNPSLLPDELFEEDHPLQGQGSPAMDRVIVLRPDRTEDISMKSKLIRAYFDYTNALNYQDDIDLICSTGYIETLMTDTMGEPEIDAAGSGNSYLSRARMMYLMELGTNDQDFKSYLTKYDKWKADTLVGMKERAIAPATTFIDPFNQAFLDKLAQYLFDQTKVLLHGQFFHITKIFGLGYISESCVELHCNANQYAAPATASDADIPKSLTITPLTNWIVRFYLSGGEPTAYEFQNSNASTFMLTNKRCLYYTENYSPAVYFSGYTHKCDGNDDLQKQVDFYRKQNNTANVKYITAQKDITADQTLCAMQWQESDYNPKTNEDGTKMVSKSGAFIWLKKGMPETPMKNADGTYNFAYSPTKKDKDGKLVYADTETLVTGDLLTPKEGYGEGVYAYSETIVTGVLLTPTEISTEVYNRINDTASATEKQSIMDGATKAMTPINPPIAVATKLYKDEEDLEGCLMKCSNPYIMNLILSKFNGTTDPDGGTSKIVTIKKIFTVNSGRCDMLANVISPTGVVEEQTRSATLVTQKSATGTVVPCKYTVSAIGAKGTGTFVTDSLASLPDKTTQAMIVYKSGPPLSDATAKAIDATRTGLESVAKTARLRSYAATGSEKKFVDCPTISCSSKDVLDAIVMQYNTDNYPKTTTNVLQKTMTKIFKVGTSATVAGNATCDINFENTSQFYTAFPGSPAGGANKTTITKRFKVQQSGTCQYTVVSDITSTDKTANLPKSSTTDLTDTVNVLDDDPSFDTLAIVTNKPSTANSLAITVTRDTSGIKYMGACPTPVFTNAGILLDIARFITAQNSAIALIVTSLYTSNLVVTSPTNCLIKVGYTRNNTMTAYMNTFSVSFTKDITICRYRITAANIAGTESAAVAGGVPITSFVRPLNSCPSVPIPCTSPAVQNEAKSFYKSMLSRLNSGIVNTMNIIKAATAGTNTCEFEVSTQEGTATSTWDGSTNFSKFHYTFNFNPDSSCDGINYVAYDMKPVLSSQSSYTVGDKIPENVACYSVLDCTNAAIKTKVINALNAAAPSGTTYSIAGTPVKTGPNKCEYLVSSTTGGVATSQDKLGSFDSTLHRIATFKAKAPIVVKGTLSDSDYKIKLNTACYGTSGLDISGTVDPILQASSSTYVPVSCPRIGTTSTSQAVFSHSTINAALVAALRNKYNDLIASGLFTVSFVKGGSFPVTQINSITIDTANPVMITVPDKYQRYEYRVVLNVGLAANASRVAAKAPAGNYNITQNDTDYAWNPYIHPIINIFFYNTCTTPVITKENITFAASRATSLYRTF